MCVHTYIHICKTKIQTIHNRLHRKNLSACQNLNIHIHIIEGSLEVKLPTIWTDEKQSREEAERRERLEERRVEEKE